MIEAARQKPGGFKLAGNNHDVMNDLGLKPGPRVGEVLNLLAGLVDAGTVENTRPALLAAAGNIQFMEVNHV